MDEKQINEPMPKPPLRRRTTRGCALEALIVVLVLFGLGYMLLPPLARVREPAARSVSSNNLKQLGIAMHTYNDSEGHLPGANAPYPDPKGSGKSYPVSWRVLLLNHFESNDLQWDYHFDEPWDGPRNILLLARMPKVYSHPKVDPTIAPKGHTHYRVFASRPGAKPSAVFTDGLPGPKLLDIPDGLGNTILIVEAAEAVPWTMPEVLLYDRNQPLPKLGGLFEGIAVAAFADGSVRSIRNDLPEDKIRAWITKDGGEPVDWE